MHGQKKWTKDTRKHRNAGECVMKIYSGSQTISEQLPDILHDESRYESGVPEKVYFPETVADLHSAIECARKDKRTVTFIGAQTGTTGGAVPEDGTYSICFSALNRIKSVNHDPDTGITVLVCEPGVTLDKIATFLSAPAQWEYNVPGVEKLAAGAFFYPPDPTEMSAQLGGTVANNASGARSYRYGATRRHIASLSLVFATGETATLKRSTARKTLWNRQINTDQGTVLTFPELPYSFTNVKNASGYYQHPEMEAIDLFIGSEGTLAAISEIGIYLTPVSKVLMGLSFFTSMESSFDFSDFLRTQTSIAAIEFFDEGSLRFIDKYRSRIPDRFPSFPDGTRAAVLWEFVDSDESRFDDVVDTFEQQLCICGSSFDTTWSGFDEKEKEKLHHFRHALPETVNSIIAENKRTCKAIRKIGTDSAFPAASFRDAFKEMMGLIKEHSLVHAAFGHLGDYHIHINLVPSNEDELKRSLLVYDQMMSIAIREKGTVSAEHGIGKIKRKFLPQMFGEQSVDIMCKIKKVADPEGMLNPGNLFSLNQFVAASH